jgi:hypothetical protein
VKTLRTRNEFMAVAEESSVIAMPLCGNNEI